MGARRVGMDQGSTTDIGTREQGRETVAGLGAGPQHGARDLSRIFGGPSREGHVSMTSTCGEIPQWTSRIAPRTRRNRAISRDWKLSTGCWEACGENLWCCLFSCTCEFCEHVDRVCMRVATADRTVLPPSVPDGWLSNRRSILRRFLRPLLRPVSLSRLFHRREP